MMFWLVIGMIIGWVFPQPTLAAVIELKIKQQFKKWFNK